MMPAAATALRAGRFGEADCNLAQRQAGALSPKVDPVRVKFRAVGEPSRRQSVYA
jgi:hypothetical protein